MTYRFVAFDLDGVLVDTVSTWVWVHKHFGVDNQTSLEAYNRGEIDDMEFMRRDIALWKDKMPDITLEDIRSILSDVPLIPGTEETLRTLGDAGVKTAIISCGLDMIANKVGREMGFDHVLANGLETNEAGHLAGDGILEVKLRDKATPLLDILKSEGIDPDECAAVGNADIDVSMFRVCGLGIAFNPSDDIVREGADVIIESKDLTRILEHVL